MDGLTITGVALTNDAAKSILSTALDAGTTFGFGYWGEASHIKRARNGEVTSMVITETEAYGGENPTPRVFKVHYLEVQRALLLILADGGKATDSGDTASKIVRDEVDGPTAEAIVQVMCFGKVIYG